MYPLKSSVEGPALWQEYNQSITEYPQDADIQDFLNIPSDMESFMALDSIEEVTEKEAACNILEDIANDVGIPQLMEEESMQSEDFSLQSNQSLIDEVESYLQLVSGSPTKVDEQDETTLIESNWNLVDIKEAEKAKVITDATEISADKIFDALITGNVVQEETEGVQLNSADLQNAITTSVVGNNGENVVIIIAQAPPPASPVPAAVSPVPSVILPYPMELSPRPAMSPAGSTGSGSDYEWSPSPASPSLYPTVGKVRKKYQRKTPTSPPSGPYPKEKTERKKAQNRTAAYKYREKKKAEQEAIDDELNHLADRNILLNKKLSEVEVQLKYMRKLMKEMGLNSYV